MIKIVKNTPLIPYFETTRYRVDAMVELANAKSGEKGADLGAGDGRILIAFAKTGVEMHGFEIDQNYVSQAQKNIQKAGITQNAILHNKNFWEEDLSSYSIITIYGMPDVMQQLEEKLQKELKPGSCVLSNYYPFPNWKEEKKKDNVYLYIKG